MAALVERRTPKPIPYDPVTVSALRESNTIPVQAVWEPTIMDRIRDQFVKIGMGTAQVLTTGDLCIDTWVHPSSPSYRAVQDLKEITKKGITRKPLMKPQNYVEMQETFLSEELFFGLLGKILYQEPDRAWYQSLLDEDVFRGPLWRQSA